MSEVVRLVVPDAGVVEVPKDWLELGAVGGDRVAGGAEVKWCSYNRGEKGCQYGAQCHFAHVREDKREEVKARSAEVRRSARSEVQTASAAVAQGSEIPPGELTGYRVVLVDPQDSRNVGSVARLCANYGIDDWVVVSAKQLDWEAKRDARIAASAGEGVAAASAPRDDEVRPLNAAFWRYAEMLATPDGIPLLRKARVFRTLGPAIEGCVAVAFTGKQGDKFRKPTVTLPQLSQAPPPPGRRVALVFGNEALGLSSNDTLLCSQICTLSTTSRCTSLNLSHCVGVVLSRLWDALPDAPASTPPAAAAAAAEPSAAPPASDATVGALLETCREVMEGLGYPTRKEQWGGAGRRRNKFTFRCHRQATALLHLAQRAGATDEEVTSITALIRLLGRRGPDAHVDPAGEDSEE
eukprot:Hpha_TRINITY_DN15581_c1_g4::TRINITY_DN15581_c1_g4_i2::g.104268::m.104268